MASTGTTPRGPPTCGGQAVPPGWPDFSSGDGEALLAPFLTCTSPAEFVALQQRVDMPRLVEALDDWRAVLLGALGPVREDAAHILQGKRASFLLTASECYGLIHAEVFALFVLHSAHDDEVDEVLRLLARDKQLGQTLALMPSVREELERRGMPLSRYPERVEQSGDVLRGLGRAARDVLSTSPGSDGTRYTEMTARRAQLPPPYQQASENVERALALRHFAPGSVALGTFDSMTFGVPLGFYYLVAGSGHGAYSLFQRQYEQAARELAPMLLMGALCAGGKGLRALAEARGAPGAGLGGARRLQLSEPHLEGLKEIARQLEERLGVDGLRELARDIQASREAGRFVAAGGVDAALALREARGDVAKAQVWLSQAKPQRRGPMEAKGGALSPKGEPPTETPIRNAHLAGKRHPVTGVPFDADGYPDFRAAGVVKAEVKITYTGSRARDFAAANKAAGFGETPKGMTWHHHQDGMTMQLVPTETHARTGHTGGFSGGQ
ncbi:HNH endonuclease [Vitiosangium sp. GDMCC 1.1324]|nr:HNH endonuclease [Vitiosangium sp. GDMCC 1.1324]